MEPLFGNGVLLCLGAFAAAYFLCWKFRSTEQKRWHLFGVAAILLLLSYIPESADPVYLQDFQLRRQFAYLKFAAYFSCVLGYFVATVRIRRSTNLERTESKDNQ
jgi:hypothetical protein